MSVVLGEALRRERIRRHETQDQTANRFSISQPSYHRWENGENNPGDKQFKKVADFLGLTVDEVFSMVHGNEQPLTLATVRQELANLTRDMDDLRGLRSALDKVSQLVATVESQGQTIERLESELRRITGRKTS